MKAAAASSNDFTFVSVGRDKPGSAVNDALCFFVASARVQDLFLCAKHLFGAAIDGWG
jgi:hypothetical protein